MAKNSKKFSKKTRSGKKNSGAVPTLLARACEGPVYISETDAPMMPFSGSPAESVTAKTAAAAAGIEYREPVETIAPQEFFAPLTAEKDWFGELEKKNAACFRELQAALKAELTDAVVYRFGSIRIDIVVAGIDKRSCISGVKTYAVET